MVTDSNGNLAARYDYLPFGQELLAGTGGRTAGQGFSNAPDGFDMKYTGQVRDPETQLDYMNARYYDPAQGRFQAMDPGNAGADPGSPQTWNGFAYVQNNPVTLLDPTGEFAEATAAGGAICGPICAGIGAAVDVAGALFGIFGGGTHTPSLTNFPFPNQSAIAMPSGGGLGPNSNGFQNAATQTMPYPISPEWPIIGRFPGVVVDVLGRSVGLVFAAILNPFPLGGSDEIVYERTRISQIPTVPILSKAPGQPTAADGYTPPKRGAGSRGEMVKNPNGPGRGYPDKNGNVWVPTGEGPLAHGGPHWDVQTPAGGRVNVYPGGRTR